MMDRCVAHGVELEAAVRGSGGGHGDDVECEQEAAARRTGGGVECELEVAAYKAAAALCVRGISQFGKKHDL